MLKLDRTLEFKETIKSNIISSFPPKKTKNLLPKPPQDTWTKQAEQVAINLRSFSTFLQSVRRAYLDIGSTSTTSLLRNNNNNNPIDTSKGLLGYEGVKYLSDRDRDEIDFGVKIALRKSVDRVRELEAAEKARLAYMSKIKPTNSLTRFLGPSSSSSSSSSSIYSPEKDPLAAHRSCITHYLNTLLAKVSQHQRIQQELRVQRQLDKNATLGDSYGLGIGNGMEGFGKNQVEKSKSQYNLLGGVMGKGKMVNGGASDSSNTSGSSSSSTIGQVPSIYRPAPFNTSSINGVLASSSSSSTIEEEPLEDLHASTSHLSSTLSPLQIQQFEAEESALLKSTQIDLVSLKLAESSLLEISSLQSQLAIHLAQQSELTDQLWEDAVGVTGKVEEGNVQLRKARERNRESRVWLLIFLIMASITLLFLDYYT